MSSSASKFIEHSAVEVEEDDARREGAQSPTSSIDTQTMMDNWRRVENLPAANEADQVELDKLHDVVQCFTALTADVERTKHLLRDPSSQSSR